MSSKRTSSGCSRVLLQIRHSSGSRQLDVAPLHANEQLARLAMRFADTVDKKEMVSAMRVVSLASCSVACRDAMSSCHDWLECMSQESAGMQ